MAPSFLSKLVHSRDRSDPGGRTPSPINGRSRALSSSTSVVGTSEFGSLNTSDSSKSNLAVKTQPHNRVSSQERDNGSDTSSFTRFTVVPPSPSMRDNIAGLPEGRDLDGKAAPEVDGLPARSVTSSPTSRSNGKVSSRPTTPSSSTRSLPDTTNSNSPERVPPVPPLPPMPAMKNDKLASPEQEVRRTSSNKSLRTLVTPNTSPSVHHPRAATAPAFHQEVDDMTPIVESPTSELPAGSILFSDDAITSHANGNGSFLGAAVSREPDAVSVRSNTTSSPPNSGGSANKKNKPWHRSNTSKPTGLASAIAASGLAMANPAFTPQQQAQFSPPVVTRSATAASSRKASLGSTGTPYMLRAGSASGGASASSQFSPPRSTKSRRSSIGSGGRRNGRTHRPSLSMQSDNGSEFIPDASNVDYYSGLEDDSDEDDEDEDDSSADGVGDDVDLALGLGRGRGRSGSSDMHYDMGLPQVTGFAVASSRRNADFHELFRSIPEGDYLIEDYGCALQREILIQGRLYISENHICFHANILGWITDLIIPIDEITSLEKKMTAFVIPNAILFTTRQTKYSFASFLSRDTTFDVIYNIWRLVRPDIGGFLGLGTGGGPAPLPGAGSDSRVVEETTTGTGSSSNPGAGSEEVHNKVTQCRCGRDGTEKHFSEIAMDTVIPGPPEKIHNLMFTSGFLKDFLVGNQQLRELQMSDWSPNTPSDNANLLLNRTMSYIKPLSGKVGPAQTKCELRDEIEFCDFSQYVSTLTTTRTPDVPSGGSFSVKTRTCITFASAISSRVVVSTEVKWTGRSLIKGIINSSAIDGQKTYHAALEKAMRAYIQAHQTEFVPEGVTLDVVVAPPTTTAVNGTSADTVSSSGGPVDVTSAGGYGKQIGFRGLQWAWETVEGTWGVAKKSTEGALELLGDIIPVPSLSLESLWSLFSWTPMLYMIIFGLVISNLWTSMRVQVEREKSGLVGGDHLMRKQANQKKADTDEKEDRERWIHGVVTALWDEMAAGKGPPQILQQPISSEWNLTSENITDEVSRLYKTLDDVEERVKGIREMLIGLGQSRSPSTSEGKIPEDLD